MIKTYITWVSNEINFGYCILTFLLIGLFTYLAINIINFIFDYHEFKYWLSKIKKKC